MASKDEIVSGCCSGNKNLVSLDPAGVVKARPYHDVPIDSKVDVETKLMENVGFQNDCSEKQAESSCNSSTVELHQVAKKSVSSRTCDAEMCNKKREKITPNPWHRLKSIFLWLLIILLGVWVVFLVLLIHNNAL